MEHFAETEFTQMIQEGEDGAPERADGDRPRRGGGRGGGRGRGGRSDRKSGDPRTTVKVRLSILFFMCTGKLFLLFRGYKDQLSFLWNTASFRNNESSLSTTFLIYFYFI